MTIRQFRHLPFLVLGLTTNTAFAACASPDEYDLLAPIGTLTGCVNLANYLKGILETTIGIAGILAVIMIVICGIQLMASGSVSGKSAAKECITNAIFGVLLAIGSWLLLNTINPLLLKNTQTLVNAVTLTTPASTATTEPNPTGPGCYFKYRDNTTGNVKFQSADTCEQCDNIRSNFQADPAHYLIQSKCYEPTKVAAPPGSTPPPVTTAGSVTCPQSGMNLCEETFRQCTNPNCARFVPMVNTYASGVATANFLKALILQESSCVARPSDVVGFDGLSAGPIHLTPATANKFKNSGSCGVTDTITLGWLAEEKNWPKSICIAAEYVKSLTGSCGNDVRNLAAGYNAGAGRCQDSASCGSDTSCDAGHTQVRQWECLYDDNAHKVCNSGLIGTRKYATNVLYCTNHPGY